MGSDDDAMIRRDDASTRWDWLRGRWDPGRGSDAATRPVRQESGHDVTLDENGRTPLVWKDRRPTAPLDIEAVDRMLRMRHDAALGDTDKELRAMTTTAERGISLGARLRARDVLPEPLVTYIEWNHRAWGRPGIDEDGEIAPFDMDPGFWETVLEAGMPASWKDRANVQAIEAEASNRGVPLIPMEDKRGAMPETQAIEMPVTGRVLPKAAANKNRGGQRAADARARAAKRAGSGSNTSDSTGGTGS